jgi:dihydroflavonol-4-reductase
MSKEQHKPKVLITGISGYIGSQVCKTFLQHGGFQVRGTVRDKSNPKKMDPLQKGFGTQLYNDLDIVEADLTNVESINAAVMGCQYIVHTAAPVFDINKIIDDEETILKPYCDGTLTVMKAAQKYKVKKVVITSSIASIVGGNKKERYTEDDWTKLDSLNLQHTLRQRLLERRCE